MEIVMLPNPPGRFCWFTSTVLFFVIVIPTTVPGPPLVCQLRVTLRRGRLTGSGSVRLTSTPSRETWYTDASPPLKNAVFPSRYTSMVTHGSVWRTKADSCISPAVAHSGTMTSMLVSVQRVGSTPITTPSGSPELKIGSFASGEGKVTRPGVPKPVPVIVSCWPAHAPTGEIVSIW